MASLASRRSSIAICPCSSLVAEPDGLIFPPGAGGRRCPSRPRPPGRMTGVAGDSVEGLLQEVQDLDADRRAALRALGRGAGVVAAGCVGGLFIGLRAASPVVAAAAASADAALDIQMLQTASSLETLLVDLYADALGTGPLGANAASAKALATLTDITARNTLVRLLTETQNQHREHRQAFQTVTLALGGKDQSGPNPSTRRGWRRPTSAAPCAWSTTPRCWRDPHRHLRRRPHAGRKRQGQGDVGQRHGGRGPARGPAADGRRPLAERHPPVPEGAPRRRPVQPPRRPCRDRLPHVRRGLATAEPESGAVP